jgi:FixJ family two-component response regulator
VQRTRPLIAVVDDEEAVRHALRRLLRSAGLDVESFASAEEFWASLCTHEPDCLVLDLQMPPPDGFELQARLVEAGSRVPIVVITGHDPSGSSEHVRAVGASDYLCKPVDESVLLGAIASALERVP